MKCH